ncbi:MAG: hypothetical protein A3F11_06320 [Gammaproteobacteria bacterium RIFCSPHIGHO2_12_FULL_37_14]|nr:MAG: hypothetical protein A3F11_06320 [Gammaproteobacteria bacterium RIFCSPHIGHO2_12_FULL_37_14]
MFKMNFPKNAFKIIHIEGDHANKNLHVHYQINGKSITASEKPEVLINDLFQLNGFSKNDANLILNLFTNEKISDKYKILSIFFDQNPVLFEIRDVLSNLNVFLSADEILSSNDILESFSKNDVIKIYFQSMKEHELTEKEEKNKLSLNKTNESQSKIYVLKNSDKNV